jgi:hypothetical protein
MQMTVVKFEETEKHMPMAQLYFQIALIIAGIFAILLGCLHFFFPYLLDFRSAIPSNGPPLKPFSLIRFQYQTTRSDVLGITWVMNHCVSYVILSIGITDLFSHIWIHSSFCTIISLWIAGFYALRAASQLYLGRRRGDWIVMIGFSSLAFLHIAVIFL